MKEVDISEHVNLAAGNCSVGFVDEQEDGPLSLGSGTLASVGGVKGILTCAHVLDAVSKRKRIGLVSFCRGPSRPQGFRVNVAECDLTQIAGDGWSSAGPDIGFLLLPHKDAETLGAYATFTTLENRRREFVEPEPACDTSFFSVVGGVHEWTGRPDRTDVRCITSFGGLSNIGKVAPAEGAEGYDFVRFTPTPDQNFRIPKNYEGVSGGGLWKFYLRDTNDGYDLVQARLLGVAFYQLGDGAIICHGPMSIYRSLYSKLPVAYAA